MLAWLSAWSEVQTCICPSWYHYHSLSLASVKSRLIFSFLVLAHPGNHGKRAVKCVCVCVCVCVTIFSTALRDWLGRTSLKWAILCRMGYKILTSDLLIHMVVQMRLPGDASSESGQVVGRYVGSQGPLPNTVSDWWRMVWEQQVNILDTTTTTTPV